MWKNDTLTTAGSTAGCPRLRNHWGEQRLAPLKTDSLGRFSWVPVPWSADPSGKHCFNRSGRVSGLGKTSWYKQRVLMHRHQGWNVRHGLCHIYMRYLYIYELFIAFVCFVVCSLLQRDGIFGVLCRKWQARESTGMFGNLMAIYYIMPQFIQNHSRFVMLMKTCMIS